MTVEKADRNKNLIILLLILIVVAIAAQTAFMYTWINNTKGNQIFVLNEQLTPNQKRDFLKRQALCSKNNVQKQLCSKISKKRAAGPALNKFLSSDIQIIPGKVQETPKEYILTYKIPSITKDNISIQRKGDFLILAINSDKKLDKHRGKQYVNFEAYSSVQKRLLIPANVDKTKVSSSFKNGELIIKMPKI